MPSFNPSSGTPRKMSPSLEQYIEAIADLLTRDKVCSISEIAAQVRVSRPAASRAVRDLSEQNLVEHRAYGYVDLTEQGQSIADMLTVRHEAIYDFMKDALDYDDDWADQEACRLEHQVDDDFVERLKTQTEFLRNQPGLNKKLRAFRKKSENGSDS